MPGARGHARDYGVITKGYRVSFQRNGNVPKLTVAVVAQLGEYTRKYWNVQLKWLDSMLCELYLNKAILNQPSNNKKMAKGESQEKQLPSVGGPEILGNCELCRRPASKAGVVLGRWRRAVSKTQL